MKIAAYNFGEEVEEICLADSGGPGLGSVRQSLSVFLLVIALEGETREANWQKTHGFRPLWVC